MILGRLTMRQFSTAFCGHEVPPVEDLQKLTGRQDRAYEVYARLLHS